MKPGFRTFLLLLVAANGIFPCLSMAQEPLFPFQPTHDCPDNITNVRTWPGVDNRPAGADGFITPYGENFVDETGHVRRFIGTNIGMTGCFPEHAAADSMAMELTRYGINIVRMHYVSHRTPKDGYPVKDSFIEPVQLERFDYLFAKLKEHGIYIYFQLNIARKIGRVNGFENAEKLPYYKNGIDNLDYRMIQLQKRFHKEILNHVNPYTGIAYKDDPAISMMELANENSIVYSWFSPKHKFPNLVEPYKTEVREMWNSFLKTKYGDTKSMLTAWSVPVNNPRVQNLAVSNDAAGASCTGVRLKQWQAYTLTLKLKSRKSSPVVLKITQAGPGGKSSSFSSTAWPDHQWKEFTYTFTSTLDEDNAKLSMTCKDGAFEAEDVVLKEGMEYRLPEGQSLENGNVDWPYPFNYFASYVKARDFTEFLATQESEYFNDLYTYLKSTLGIRQSVAGTQVTYGFNQPQSYMDYCDIHGYWCHPYFPTGKWDNGHWQLRNSSILSTRSVYDYSNPASTITDMAHARILGKPFTVSEYDHPNLNSYCAEGNLVLSAMAALQNWSALMQFAWILNTDYKRDFVWQQFDMCSAPQKLVHLPACYAMFVRRDVRKASDNLVYAAPSDLNSDIEEVTRARTAKGHENPHSALLSSLPLVMKSGREVEDRDDLFNPNGRNVIRTQADVPDAIRQAYENHLMKSVTGEITYDWQKEDAGLFTVDTRNTKVFSGYVRGRSFVYSGMKLTPGKTRLDWMTLTLTLAIPYGNSRAANILRPGAYLLSATGVVQNTGQKTVKVDPPQHGRVSCCIPDGGNPGKGPVLCEGIPAKMTFAGIGGRARCYALDPNGNRMEELPVGISEAGEAILEIGPKYKTLWYEFIVEEKK